MKITLDVKIDDIEKAFSVIGGICFVVKAAKLLDKGYELIVVAETQEEKENLDAHMEMIKNDRSGD
jgi:hypothetical protein